MICHEEMNIRLRPVLAILFSLACGIAFAQTGEPPAISPDRPGVGTPPSLVPKNHLQVEAGFSFNHFHDDDVTTDLYSWAQLLVRFGLFSFAEVRFSTDIIHTRQEAFSGTSSSTGLSAFSVGTKVALFPARGALPQAAVMLNFILPDTGKAEYQVQNIEPAVFLLFQNTLSDRLNLGYNLGWAWAGESNRPTTFYAVNLGLDLTGALNVFIESYGYLGSDGNNHFIDGGFAYQLTGRLQIDASGGLSTKGADADTQVGFGLSWLFP